MNPHMILFVPLIYAKFRGRWISSQLPAVYGVCICVCVCICLWVHVLLKPITGTKMLQLSWEVEKCTTFWAFQPQLSLGLVIYCKETLICETSCPGPPCSSNVPRENLNKVLLLTNWFSLHLVLFPGYFFLFFLNYMQFLIAFNGAIFVLLRTDLHKLTQVINSVIGNAEEFLGA